MVDLNAQLGYPTQLHELLPRLNLLLQNPAAVVLVAEEDGQLLGWTTAEIQATLESDPRAVLNGLIVREGHRSKGIGAQLVRALADWAREQGVDRLRVRTNVARLETHRFYEKNGFKLTKEQRIYELALRPKAGEQVEP